MKAARHRRNPTMVVFLVTILILVGSSSNLESLADESGPIEDISYLGSDFMFKNIDKPLLRYLNSLKSVMINNTEVYYNTTELEASDSKNIQEKDTYEINLSSENLSNTLEKINQTYLDESTKALLNSAIDELNNHSSLLLNRTIATNLLLERQLYARSVIILWDPDGSAKKALIQLQNGKIPEKQPFSGDEVITQIQIGFFQESISGIVSLNNTWSYKNNDNASAVQDFINWALKDPRVTRLLAIRGTPTTKFHFFLGPASIEVTGSTTREQPTIDFLQMRLESVTLERKDNVTHFKTFKTTVQETHLTGVFVWNDTNDNNKVEQWIAYNERERPFIGPYSEITQRFDFKQVGTVEFEPIVIDDEGISFSMSLVSVEGVINSVGEPTNLVALNQQTPGINEYVEYFNTSFQFVPDANTGEATLKLANAIGTWNNTNILENCGLSLVYTTSYNSYQLGHKINLGSYYFDPDSLQSHVVPRINYQDLDDREIGSIDLTSDLYTYNDSENYNVLGTIIPLEYVRIVLSQTEQAGRFLKIAKESPVGRNTVLFAITYPIWEGQKIFHDPTFSVFAGKPIIFPTNVVEGIATVLQPSSVGLVAVATIGLIIISIRQKVGF